MGFWDKQIVEKATQQQTPMPLNNNSAPWWKPQVAVKPPETITEIPPVNPGTQLPPNEQRINQLRKTGGIADTGHCPSCGSGNFITASLSLINSSGVKVSSSRCFDCGYPVVQSSSGDTMPSSSGNGQPTHVTRQLPTPGFQPQTIVGKI